MREFDSTFLRILEPEVMDGDEQCDAYASADFSDVNMDFVRRWLEVFPEARQGLWLDLGCGPAEIPGRVCTALPEVSMVGVDASNAMISQAKRRISNLGLSGRIELFEGYISDLSRPVDGFDALMSNSLLHHLPDPELLWREVLRLGKAGSPLMVMDLRRPRTQDDAAALVALHAEGDPDVLRRDFFNSLLASFTPQEVRGQLDQCGLTTLQVASISDRHLLVWGHLPG